MRRVFGVVVRSPTYAALVGCLGVLAVVLWAAAGSAPAALIHR